MKSFVQKLDVAGLLLFILGFGFKVMHWPGAQLLWFLGCTLCTLPLIAKLKQSKSFLTKMFYLLLILFVLLTLCWGNLNVILLKQIHWGLLIAILVLKMLALLNAVNSANSTSRFVEKRLIILIFLSAITFCTSFGLVYFFYWANVIGTYIFFTSVFLTISSVLYYFKHRFQFEHLQYFKIKIDAVKLGMLVFFLFNIQNSFWNKIPKFIIYKDYYTYEKLQVANKKYISETELININSFSPEIQKMATTMNTNITNEIYEIQDLKIGLLNFYNESNYQIKKHTAGYVIEIHSLNYPFMFTNEYFRLSRASILSNTLEKYNAILLKSIKKYDFQINNKKHPLDSSAALQTNQFIRNSILSNLAYFDDETNLFTMENSKELYSEFSDSWCTRNFDYLPMISALAKLTEIENKLLKLRYETLVFLSIQNDLTKK